MVGMATPAAVLAVIRAARPTCRWGVMCGWEGVVNVSKVGCTVPMRNPP